MNDEHSSFCQKAREELSAYIDGESIVIGQSQELIHESDAALIYLSPDQVPVVIMWLQQLLSELDPSSGG